MLSRVHEYNNTHTDISEMGKNFISTLLFPGVKFVPSSSSVLKTPELKLSVVKGQV